MYKKDYEILWIRKMRRWKMEKIQENITKSVAASGIYNSLGRNYLKSFKDIVGVNTIASSYE